MANGLDDVTWDSSSAKIRFGTTKVALTKFDRSKVENKRDKIKPIGSMIATKRTPGAIEIGDTSAEMLATDWVARCLPKFGRHGWSLIEFQITLNRSHPAVSGSYGIVLDRCSIVSTEEPIANDEKAATVKIGINVMNVWERGGDGLWKCMARLDTLPSSQALALMDF